MIIAPSRSSVQLLASRVVFAQSHSWKSGKSSTRNFHNHKSTPHNFSNNHQHSSFISPFLNAGFSFSTSFFSPINIAQFGTRSMSSMSKRFGTQERQRIYISSPGQLISPFLPPASTPPLLSVKGWQSRYKSLKNIMISIISGQQIKSRLKTLNEKFSSRLFRSKAQELYTSINTAIAAGDIGTLRSQLTESMYSVVAKEVGLKQRQHSRPVNLSWSAELDPPKVVCVRFSRVSAEKLEDFGQVTVYFQGKQTVSVNDISGKVVSSTTSNVSEYWTFERHLQKYGSWRLCAKPTHSTIENLGW